MSYARRVDRHDPALVLLLVDQSESMADLLPTTGESKAASVARKINSFLHELVLRCVKSPREAPRPYFFVDVLGYSTEPDGRTSVTSLVLGDSHEPDGLSSTTWLASNPLRVHRVVNAEAAVAAPVWVDPAARGGTPMCAALDAAGRLAARWVKRHPDAFPPIVLNLSDGESTDGDPRVWANRIRSLRSTDGSLLLFNINISSGQGQSILFPEGTHSLPPPERGDYARTLLEMSSTLPDVMVASARSQGIDIRAGARGFALNADMKSLALFLNIGTAVGRPM